MQKIHKKETKVRSICSYNIASKRSICPWHPAHKNIQQEILHTCYRSKCPWHPAHIAKKSKQEVLHTCYISECPWHPAHIANSCVVVTE